MKRGVIVLISCVLWFASFAQDIAAYQLYDSKGKAVNFKKCLKDLSDADVVLFGELHNDAIAHWMQLEVTKALYKKHNDRLVLGAEMFEADNQLIINEYLNDLISTKSFENEARLWDNYVTDYKPLLEFAHENKLPFIATNIPRRYASIVYKKGAKTLDNLSEAAKKYIAPLPFPYDSTLSCYKELLSMSGGMPGHTNQNFPMSQAVKDATMAYFIVQNLPSEGLFLHFNGAYHSDNYESIYWYLKNRNPNLKITTITTVNQDSISKLDQEYYNKADFILCTPTNMTKTY